MVVVNLENIVLFISIYGVYIYIYMKQHIVVVGTGWASDRFLKEIDLSQYTVTVISPADYFLYTPKLIYSAFSDYNPCFQLLIGNSIDYIKETVSDIMFEDNTIYTSSISKPIYYDYLVLAHGAHVQTFGIKGVEEHCICIKDLSSTTLLKEQLVGENKKVAVIGCGLAGTDIIGLLIDQKKHFPIAIDAMKGPLGTMHSSISRYIMDIWRDHDVKMYFGDFVNQVTDKEIYIGKEIKQPYDIAVWCGGIKPNTLTQTVLARLHKEHKKGIPVDLFFKVQTLQNVYAIGDCADTEYYPTAQVASQQGRYLARYFNEQFTSSAFHYKHKGTIGYIGGGESIYQNGDFVVRGKIVTFVMPFVHFYTQWVS
jgi:NADH:ubiquinone reductase (non-electrogenic)